MNNTITDVPGIRIGHYTDKKGITGCTVVLCQGGAVGGVDVRGSAPGTRETDLMRPMNLVQEVHAVLLTGGSAYGLDAAGGVMRWLEEREIGFNVGVGVVPIVPAAVLFDLTIGDPKARPDAGAGYQACQSAADGPVAEGNVGAGTGATSPGPSFALATVYDGFAWPLAVNPAEGEAWDQTDLDRSELTATLADSGGTARLTQVLREVAFDTEGKFYNNLFEFGPGFRITPNADWGLFLMVEYHRGRYADYTAEMRSAREIYYGPFYNSVRFFLVLDRDF